MPRVLLLLTLAVTLALTMSLTPATIAAPATAPDDDFVYFPQTGHHVGLKFKRFYDANGGLDIFGLPLTEAFIEDGLQVQYFERARFEYHPELPADFRVTLTLLGRHFTEGRAEPAFQWLPNDPGGDRHFFAESGHTLGGAFRGFWQGRGGLPAFGFPISEELEEVNPADGKSYLVQYFERARFEYHPENLGTPYEVQLGQLGRQFLDQRPTAQVMLAPVPALQLLGKATTVFATSAEERRQNIARATELFDGLIVPAGQEFSFLSVGDFSEEAGFVEGYAIVGGRLEKVIGGGLCQVSTTMFRAVSNAGLDITSRRGHQFVVYFYENILGFDATVFSPDLDFRWRNDSPGPVVIAAKTNPDAATVTFQIWGVNDGRQTSYQGPFVRNVVRPGAAQWQYDPEMPAGAVKQLVHGRAGMDVNFIRTVRMPDGKVKHYDDFFTHYQPWNDFFTYGAGYRAPAGRPATAPPAPTPAAPPAPTAAPGAGGR